MAPPSQLRPDFPTVSREGAIAALAEAKSPLLARVVCAG
jgi:hypothetical protein